MLYHQELTSKSANAVEIALLLAKNPAPPMPVYPLDDKYLDPYVLADAIDVLFREESVSVHSVQGVGGAEGGGSSSYGGFGEQLGEQEPLHGGTGGETFVGINESDAIASCTR
jgi:hypothetical protein